MFTMKKTLLFVMLFTLLICYNSSLAQSSSRKIASWEAGAKQITEHKIDSDTAYTFMFRNAKYTTIVDFESEVIGSKEDYIEFVNFIDSVTLKVVLEKGENKTFQFGNLKNIILDKMLGQNIIVLYDNKMSGYCYIDRNDIKKMKAAIEKM